MKFPGTSACLTAVHLHFQPINNSSKARAIGTPTAPSDNSGDPSPPQPALGASPAFPSNILCNKYKGPNYFTWHPWTTLNINNVDQSLSPFNSEALDIKIIGPTPFAHILQDGTPTFQLQITPMLLKEHLGANTTTLEPKTEEQMLH
ncbi:hypothetical protein C0993_007979 [Termitomyces sp. T159_Od127]|nr:hypothetical protein C0993_007979 [Termitomyces sp. T159_Od127]